MNYVQSNKIQHCHLTSTFGFSERMTHSQKSSSPECQRRLNNRRTKYSIQVTSRPKMSLLKWILVPIKELCFTYTFQELSPGFRISRIPDNPSLKWMGKGKRKGGGIGEAKLSMQSVSVRTLCTYLQTRACSTHSQTLRKCKQL